jgi:hypothetical protein
VFVPATVNELPVAEIVPGEVFPLPQLIVAVKSLATACPSASVNVATLPLKA